MVHLGNNREGSQFNALFKFGVDEVQFMEHNPRSFQFSKQNNDINLVSDPNKLTEESSLMVGGSNGVKDKNGHLNLKPKKSKGLGHEEWY